MGVTSKDAVSIPIFVLFELVELAAFEPFVCQQLPQNKRHPALKESDILLAIAFLLHVQDIHLPPCRRHGRAGGKSSAAGRPASSVNIRAGTGAV